MGFLEDFEEGGDLHDDVQDALYLSNRADADMVVQIKETKKLEHHDEHDKYPGEEFMVLEGTVVKLDKGQGNKKGGVSRDLEEGDVISMTFGMYDNVKKSHKKNLFRELREMLAAASATREQVVGDDIKSFIASAAAGEYNGNYVRITTKPANDDGYRNFQVIAFDEDDLS